ncbi:hypothetical protein L083_2774 [Actinoplanes sp. N902-109]|nr:hypothetical protein L083_2774 [Actinoplanes sp. N902-109]
MAVVASVDGSEAAAAEQLLDAVTSGEHEHALSSRLSSR